MSTKWIVSGMILTAVLTLSLSFTSGQIITMGKDATADAVDETGTASNNEIAVFTDENTIEGESNITHNAGVTTVSGTITLVGATPTMNIGDDGEEDIKFVYLGNAKDFFMCLDDSADDLVIGLGSVCGTTPALRIDEDLNITYGDATESDIIQVYDGNAQDFYSCLDDSADDLIIGIGSACGTTPAIIVDEDQKVRFGAAGTNDGNVHILAPDTSTAPLVVESPASTGNNNIIMQYDGTAAIQFGVKAADRSLRFAPADLGNDALGPWIDMGRNSNGTSAGGAAIALTDRGNQRYYIWAADDGNLHIGTTAPIGSQDTSGSVVGGQSSPEAIKDILHTNSIEDAGTALAEVVDTPTHRFTYKKEDRHPGIVHVGLAVPDGEMPWYAQSPATYDDYLDDIPLVPGTGKNLNEINLFGYLILSIQALNEEIEELKQRIPQGE